MTKISQTKKCKLNERIKKINSTLIKIPNKIKNEEKKKLIY